MQISVLGYFERTAEAQPHRPAVRDAKTELSFRQLRELALRVASALPPSQDGRPQPVVLLMPKSVHWLVGLLGSLYAGHIYAPLDAKTPPARLRGICEKLSPIAILAVPTTVELASSLGVPHVLDIGQPNAGAFPTDRWRGLLDADPAYIIHTSGSTGLPKGVAISHRSIIDYIDWALDTYPMTGEEVIGNQAPYYFDNSTLDFYLSFATGATLLLIPEELFSFPARLLEWLTAQQASFIFWVPSILVNIANMGLLVSGAKPPLTHILFAGEVMPNRQLNFWRSAYPSALFSNLYGPTEITVDCTYLIVSRPFTDEEPLPIGIPCRNSDVLILDGNRKVNEPGEVGELCVRGTSLALGYWNDPEKTAEKFVQNPLNPNFPERLYRTGDLASYNSLGEIMFHGRMDFQIKHQGYRIELGEIENACLTLPGLRNACVLYQRERKEITLFYEADAPLAPADLRTHLGQTLPKYMWPTVLHHLPELPRNPNGKIDRKALGDRLE
jgi:amino acid adenylation domain-containing protein